MSKTSLYAEQSEGTNEKGGPEFNKLGTSSRLDTDLQARGWLVAQTSVVTRNMNVMRSVYCVLHNAVMYNSRYIRVYIPMRICPHQCKIHKS